MRKNNCTKKNQVVSLKTPLVYQPFPPPSLLCSLLRSLLLVLLLPLGDSASEGKGGTPSATGPAWSGTEAEAEAEAVVVAVAAATVGEGDGSSEERRTTRSDSSLALPPP